VGYTFFYAIWMNTVPAVNHERLFLCAAPKTGLFSTHNQAIFVLIKAVQGFMARIDHGTPQPKAREEHRAFRKRPFMDWEPVGEPAHTPHVL